VQLASGARAPVMAASSPDRRVGPSASGAGCAGPGYGHGLDEDEDEAAAMDPDRKKPWREGKEREVC
jgi:hypothetical protein